MSKRKLAFFHSPVLFLISLFIPILIVAVYLVYRGNNHTASRSFRLRYWLREPQAHQDWAVKAGDRCANAPFSIPTDGYIGFLWGDSFYLGHTHQGIDIFGGAAENTTPIIAAYGGFLTHLYDWKSSVIIRIPDDPLHPGRQIWTYYTHMASSEGDSYINPDFPPGTSELFVEQGTLLGYQGNYSGAPGNPTGIHLHFSIVLDDGQGGFRNELEFKNTLDPSPYLGIQLNTATKPDEVPICKN